MYYLQTNFTGGEVSDLLRSRVDFSKYYNSCRTLENMFVHPIGAAIRRPGTKYIASVKTASKKVRLISFVHSTPQAYILEFGDEYIRFFKDGGQILDNGDPYEITSPYAEADLFNIHVKGSADVMYITCPGYAVRKLSRTGHTAWTLEEVTFDRGPFLPENDTSTTVTPDGVTGDITVTASASIFTEAMEGALLQISHPRDDNDVSGTFTGVANSDEILTKGDWTFLTKGTWTADIEIQRSYDGSTWLTYRTYTSSNNFNAKVDGSEPDDDVLYRIRCTDYTSGNVEYTFSVADYIHNGVVEITAYTSGTVVDATVIVDLHATDATKKWAEGAWSERRGYPRSLSFFEDRLFFAGTTHKPLTVWGSKSGDYEKMEIGTNDNDALIYTPSVAEQNYIQWIQDHDTILIGTTAHLLKLGSSDDSAPLSPTNPRCKKQVKNGSFNIQPESVNDVILFVEYQEKKILEVAFSAEKSGWLGGYVVNDMTFLADHITGDGITAMAHQSNPFSLLWCPRQDGQIPVMTYERGQKVVGWGRCITDGEFESGAIIPGDDEDEVWVSVKRTINGSDVRYIERFEPINFGGALQDGYFFDSGLSYDGVATSTLSGLSHLEGETVDCLADNAVFQDLIVSGGEITLPVEVEKAHAGLPFRSVLAPVRPEVDMRDGTSQGRIKRINGVIVRLKDSWGCKIGDSLDNLDIVPFIDMPLATGTLFTGDKEISYDSSFSANPDMYIVQDLPLPLTVLCIVSKLEITGK